LLYIFYHIAAIEKGTLSIAKFLLVPTCLHVYFNRAPEGVKWELGFAWDSSPRNNRKGNEIKV
jgi:hypothetical protein